MLSVGLELAIFRLLFGAELSMGELDQAQTRPEPENASPNPAEPEKNLKL